MSLAILTNSIHRLGHIYKFRVSRPSKILKVMRARFFIFLFYYSLFYFYVMVALLR